MIDLSDDEPDSIGAFVYYLYNLNYDAALFKKEGDHLSLHVQMCILGDKYDMRTLQDLAMEKIKTLTSNGSPTSSDLANAAICAYDAIGATTEIRRMIVNLAIEKGHIPTEINAEPVTDFERAMHTCVGLCLDIVKAQQGMMVKASPKSFGCPAKCGHIQRHPITLQSFGFTYMCSKCTRTYYGWQWWQCHC